MDRTARAFLTFVVVGFAALPSSALAQSPKITGTWTGTAAQNVGKSNYTVVMTITSAGGETSYPELN
jgi:hypothetical protein